MGTRCGCRGLSWETCRNPETSGLFQYLNVNKKGVTLNLESGATVGGS